MSYLRILIPLAFVAGSTRCPATTGNDGAWLRGWLRATARAKPTAEHAVVGRYCGLALVRLHRADAQRRAHAPKPQVVPPLGRAR